MKCKIEEKKVSSRIPEVGEPWRHRNHSSIFMRIRDEHGCHALKDVYTQEFFYSVDILNGLVARTPRSDNSIIILQPKGDEIIFEEKASGD